MTIATRTLLFSLALDTFAVALGLGISGLSRSRWIKIGIVFGFFEGVMPAVGLLIGNRLSHAFGSRANWIGGILLILVGAYALKEGVEKKKEASPENLEGAKLLLTGLSISLDELALGFSLGALSVSLEMTLAYIAIQALVITFAGLALGARLGKRLESKAEIVASLVLIGAGILLLAGCR